MDLFITTRVFDPSLGGKAIRLTGCDVDGDIWDDVYLVGMVDGQDLIVTDRHGKQCTLNMENFEQDERLKLQLLQPIQEDVVEERKPITRTFDTRQYRSTKQINKENAEVERMLQENIEPMKLEDILCRMRKLRYIHWNNNNASGFVKHAIKCGMNIKKVDRGVYSYDWDGGK